MQMQISEQQIESIIACSIAAYKKSNKKDYTPILFNDWINEWLEIHKMNIAVTTYYTYKEQINKTIIPYFLDNPVYIQKFTALDIEILFIFTT